MKIIISILTITFLSLFLLSCAKEEKKLSVLYEGDLEEQMINLYEEAYEAFIDDGDSLFAAKKFSEAELIFPQSEWAPVAALMTAYVYYSDDYYKDAIYHLERYLKTYPNHKDKSYGHYLLAMCYYENIIDEQRDLAPLLNAKKEFRYIVKEFPNSEFSLDAKYKLDLIEDRLAGKEMFIGRHYAKSKKWIPAINRFKNVVDNYDTSIYVEEAMHRLAEIYYILGIENEARKYASLLGYNYGSSRWYKATYKIFNKDYDLSEREIFSLKDENKKSLLSKFKKRFNDLLN